MSDTEFSLKTFKSKMDQSVNSLKHEFSSLRTGRASTALVDQITVDAYGSKMPLNQVATVSVPEPRQISISVWDKGLVLAVDKAIRDANIGLNPAVDGVLIRIPIPQLTEERRKEFVKLAKKYAENSRIAIRSIRKDANDTIKSLKISDDEKEAHSNDVQNITDEHIKIIDDLLDVKEKDIMEI